VAAVLACSGCNDSRFDRNHAQQLIQESENLKEKSQRIKVRDGTLKSGQSQGLWSIEDGQIVMSERASNEITSVDENWIVPNVKLPMRVEITGLAESPLSSKIKSAEFNYVFDNVPPILRRFIFNGGTGRANFQLYDDGWRLIELDLRDNNELGEISAQDQAAIARDISTEAERENHEYARMTSHWTPTKTGMTLYTTRYVGNRNGEPVNRQYKVVFTDVAMDTYTSEVQNGPWALQSSYWYGAMAEPSEYNSRNIWFRRPRHPRVSYDLNVKFGTMDTDAGSFQNIVASYRNNWRNAHADSIGADFARDKYIAGYYRNHSHDGIPM
jgi:hypothetical protein